MAMIGFESLSEAYCYFTAFMCGVSMLLPINAIFSAPLYIMHYYQYVINIPDAPAEHANFWNNAMTYYILVCLVTSLIAEPLTLTKTFRRIPLQVRMLSALVFLWVEIIVLMVVPAVGSTEVGAIATIVIAGFISGSGKSVFEATAYGLFSAFPHRFMASLMGGAGVAGALTSILQIIVKAALPEDYEGIRVQSKIFYGLMVGIQGITFIMLIFLRWNTYAMQYTGALSGENTKDVNDVDAVEEKSTENPSSEDPQPTSESLVGTNIFSVLKTIYPMTIACAFNFFLTLLLFPTVVVSVDPEDYWYGTVAVCIFNVCDVFGRFAPSLKALWPPRWAVIGGSFARVIFLPLLLLASYHYIPGHAYNYVMMVLFGLSNGYIGGLTLVLGPLTKGLTTSGQRFVAGTMLGVSILVGGAIGTALSIMMQTLRENSAS